MQKIFVCDLKKTSMALAIACLPAVAMAAQQDAYQVSVQALQDIGKNTDVIVTLKPNQGGVNPATMIKHVQLKSIDLTGNLRWTKNEMNVPTQVNAQTGSSSSTKTYNDMSRRQPVQVQLNVQTGQTTKTEVLRTSTPVMFRPDLTVSEVRHEETVRVGEVLNIAASIKELNGDLGATTTVRLMQGQVVLDRAAGLVVNKGGTSQAVFSTKFEKAGTYTMTIATDAINPGDYDASNNSKTITVKVVDVVKPSTYYLSYWHQSGSYGQTYSNWYYNNYSYRYTGEQQSFSHQIQSEQGVVLAFPIAKASVQVNLDSGQHVFNKEVQNIEQTYGYEYGCYSNKGGSAQMGDGIVLYVSTQKNCGNYEVTYANFNQYAADFVTYSQNHDYYWGEQIDVQKNGTVWRAKNTISSRLMITARDGTSFGGTAAMSLTQSSNVYDYTEYWGRNWADQVYVSGWGQGASQP